MTDKKILNRKTIDFSDVYERGQWAMHWRITKQQLFGARRATGSNKVEAIKNYLKQKGLVGRKGV